MTDTTPPVLAPTPISEHLANYDDAMERAAKAFRKAEKKGRDVVPEVYYDRDDSAVAFAEIAAETIRELLALMPAVDEVSAEIEASCYADDMDPVFEARDAADDLLGRIYTVLIPPTPTQEKPHG